MGSVTETRARLAREDANFQRLNHKHQEYEQRNKDPCSKVRLRNHKRYQHSGNKNIRQKTYRKTLYVLCLARQRVGQKNDYGDLCEFRGLKANGPYPKPPYSCSGLYTETRNKNQNKQR